MSLRKLLVTSSLMLIACTAAPAKASADWLFTPFIGGTFGGSADFGGEGQDFRTEFDQRLSYGASLAAMGGGVFGFELDFGYSPNFFRPADDSTDINFVGDSNMTTLTANLIVGAPLGGVRPYVVGGFGLMRGSVDNAGQFFDKPSSNDFGYDVGGGLMIFPAENIGIRGDIRYFRSLQKADLLDLDFNPGQLRFWRGTVGVTFKF